MELDAEALIQGTIAPDVIESTRGGAGENDEDYIKLHHNVGGLPKNLKIRIIEPLKNLFKYQVRKLGELLGVPRNILEKQPFPGPGLSVRIAGKITKEKLAILRRATEIVETKLKLYKPSQYFAYILDSEPNIKLPDISWKIGFNKVIPAKILSAESVGVKGDRRVKCKIMVLEKTSLLNEEWIDLLNLQARITGIYENICRVAILVDEAVNKEGYGIIIRAVNTRDYMTAIPSMIPAETLREASSMIRGVSDKIVFTAYEITTKPASTIELM